MKVKCSVDGVSGISPGVDIGGISVHGDCVGIMSNGIDGIGSSESWDSRYNTSNNIYGVNDS